MDYAALIQMLQQQNAEEPFRIGGEANPAYTAAEPSMTGGILGGLSKAAGPFGQTLGAVASIFNALAARKAEKERRKREERAMALQYNLEGARLLSSGWDSPRYGEGRY